MFSKHEKRPPGWAFVVLGLVLCAVSLLGLSGALGPLPAAGRAATLTVIGIPIGVVAIIIGIVKLSRGGRDRQRRE